MTWLIFLMIAVAVVFILIREKIESDAKEKKEQRDLELQIQKQIAADNEYREGLAKLRQQLTKGFNIQAPGDTAKYLFIDFETTNLPPDYKIPADPAELILLPYIVQASCLVYNSDRELIDTYSSIINPGDVPFSGSSVKIHKITKEKARNQGVPITEFLTFFRKYINAEAIVIAHNIKFDNYMLKLEAKRNNIRIGSYTRFCTMESTKEDVGLYKEYGRGYKYPKLIELTEFCFTKGHKIKNINLHDSLVDVKLCALCFFEMELYELCEES